MSTLKSTLLIPIRLISLLLSVNSTFAQPDTLWTRTYGGSLTDCFSNMQLTQDGGIIMIGYTYISNDNSDFWLIKTDLDGDTIWTKTYGGDSYDYGLSVRQTQDGGYIVAGVSSIINYFDAYLIKTDSLGNIMWDHTYIGDDMYFCYCAIPTSDSGYIMTGFTEYSIYNLKDLLLIKTDDTGNQLWMQTIDNDFWDVGCDILQTSDNDYIIAGHSGDSIYEDIILVKTDSLGNILWQNTFGGDYDERGFSLQSTNDGGIIIAGRTSSFGSGMADIYLIKTDSGGNELWSRTYGGSFFDAGWSVKQTLDEGFIIGGYISPTYQDNPNVYIIKTDSLGNPQWDKTIGGDGDDRSICLQIIEDGYLIAGNTNSFGNGGYDFYLIRLDAEGTLVEDFGNNPPADFTLYPPYPNPFNSSITIAFDLHSASEVELTIYDIQGREITALDSGGWVLGKNTAVWDASDCSSGVYFVHLTAGEYQKTQKLVLMK